MLEVVPYTAFVESERLRNLLILEVVPYTTLVRDIKQSKVIIEEVHQRAVRPT
jgi:hypothetical protein